MQEESCNPRQNPGLLVSHQVAFFPLCFFTLLPWSDKEVLSWNCTLHARPPHWCSREVGESKCSLPLSLALSVSRAQPSSLNHTACSLLSSSTAGLFHSMRVQRVCVCMWAEVFCVCECVCVCSSVFQPIAHSYRFEFELREGSRRQRKIEG